MKFLIIGVASVALAGLILFVVGGSGIFDVSSMLKAFTKTDIPPVTKLDKVAKVATTSLNRSLVERTKTTTVPPSITKESVTAVTNKVSSEVKNDTIKINTQNPAKSFQDSMDELSELIHASSTLNTFKTESVKAVALKELDGIAIYFFMLRLEDYKVKHVHYPEFGFSVSLNILNASHIFEYKQSTDFTSYTLCYTKYPCQIFDQKIINEWQLRYSSANLTPPMSAEDFLESMLRFGRWRNEDYSVEAKLRTLRAEAEIFSIDNKDSYLGVCVANQDSILKDSLYPDKVICNDSKSKFAAEAYLPYKRKYFCVDSSGYGDESIKSKGPTALFCPQS